MLKHEHMARKKIAKGIFATLMGLEAYVLGLEVESNFESIHLHFLTVLVAVMMGISRYRWMTHRKYLKQWKD